MSTLARLSRDRTFLTSVRDGTGDGGVVFCDLPDVNGAMGKFLVRSMASLAEIDAERDEAAAGIGKQVHRDRTRAALVAAKARGTKLGGYRGGPVPDPMLGGAARREAADAFAARLAPTLSEMRGRKLSLHHMAAELTAKEIRTPRGGAWTATSVRNALARCAGSAVGLTRAPAVAEARDPGSVGAG